MKKYNIKKEIAKEYSQGKDYYQNVEEKQDKDKFKRHTNKH